MISAYICGKFWVTQYIIKIEKEKDRQIGNETLWHKYRYIIEKNRQLDTDVFYREI